ncbi:MAG: hypothetical protein K2P41_02400 [Lachnospiraceae bacterium]|nr:hypothetical protein [Lachnospiraceae bacterium]
MAAFNKAVLTANGNRLLIAALSGNPIEFIRLETGSGIYDGTENLSVMEGLKNKQQEFPFFRYEREMDKSVTLVAMISNEGLDMGYRMTEIGIYGKMKDSDEEVLYSIATAVTDEADFWAPFNGVYPSKMVLYYHVTMSPDATPCIVMEDNTVLAEIAAESNRAHAAELLLSNQIAEGVYGALTDAKAYADRIYTQASGYTDERISELINGAPSTLDTLKEIADAMQENESVMEALETAIGSKASEIEYQEHAANKTIHILESERNGWNEAVEKMQELGRELEEIRVSFQNGCSLIAGKLTACGADTPGNTSPETIAVKIQMIYDDRYRAGAAEAMVGNATASQVLAERTFTNSVGSGQTGTMPNRGAVSQTLNCGGSYTVPAGYHSGSGKVTANSLASQTSANAAAANISSGKTAWVNGVKVTGTGADNTTNYNNGYSAGRTQGRNDVKNSPNSYGLYTKTQYDANYTGGYNAGVTAADGRVNVNSVNYKTGYDQGHVAGTNEGYRSGYDDGVNHVKNNPGSYSLYTKAQYDANYSSGYNAGMAAVMKNLQVRAKAHSRDGVCYFYVRVYNTSGWGLMFDGGGNDMAAKDGSGYVTLGTFST